MDLEPSEEAAELRDNVRTVLASICPPKVVRAVCEGDGDVASLWAKMVELDWPAIAIPEKHGGLGLGFLEVALVAEELGRAAVPGPWLATVTQFAPVVREAGLDSQFATELAARVAAGELTGTVALAEDGCWDSPAVTTSAARSSAGWELNGAKSAVLDGATADELAVVARSEAGLGIFVVPLGSVAASARRVVDPTLPIADIVLDGVVVPTERVLAEPGTPGVSAALERAGQEATVALAIGLVGTCRVIFEQTVEYAKMREQYGRPIGSFQALQHRMADMYLAVERASALCDFAALTIAEDDPRRATSASMAKAAAGECQRLVVQDGLQLHGGIGYTWEHDLHFWLKRATSADALYGNAVHHRARLVVALGLSRHEARAVT